MLASGVVEALSARAHVVVAPAGTEALRDEMVAVIAPALEEMAPHLARGVAERSGKPLATEDADEILSAVVMQITEQLMESDHVNDIYSEDRIIRRDAYRAIRDILVDYIHGGVVLDEEPATDTSFQVKLDRLGYVVSTAARRLDESLLTESLLTAAGSVGAAMLDVDIPRLTACFELAGGAEVGRLALEEAISEEILALVETGIVELPHMEQALEIDESIQALTGFDKAVARATVKTSGRTGCAAECTVLDTHTLKAKLTPLSEASATALEGHFAFFLTSLETELCRLAEKAVPTTRPASEKLTRRGATVTGAKRNEVAKAPRRPAPARASRTRARGGGVGTKKRGA